MSVAEGSIVCAGAPSLARESSVDIIRQVIVEGRADPEDVVHAEVDASERLLVEQQRGHVVRFDLAVALHSPLTGV